MSIPSLSPSRHVKLALAGGALAAGAILSVVNLDLALRREAGILILWLGWLSLGLIAGSASCVFFAIAGFFQARKRPTGAAVEKRPERRDYLAKYSGGDKAVALGVAASSAVLAISFVSRSASWTATAISMALVCWAAYYLIHVLLTQVLFSANRIVARRPFQREFSESYSNVKRISGKPGTVKVEFADGRSLKLHSGLGNADIVISFLRRHCSERLEVQ